MTEQRQAETSPSLWLVTGLLLASLLMLSACNTVSGLGRDVESAGETLSETAEDAKE